MVLDAALPTLSILTLNLIALGDANGARFDDNQIRDLNGVASPSNELCGGGYLFVGHFMPITLIRQRTKYRSAIIYV